jgi:hypothetical protein
MTGFLIPIDGAEALLVASVEQFVLCDGPEINEIVHVTLPRRPAQGELERLLGAECKTRVVGILTVGATVLDGHCVDIFQIRAAESEVVKR